MEESIVPSTSYEKRGENRIKKSESNVLIDLVAQLSENLLKGCVCDIKPVKGTNNINPSTDTFGTVLREILKALDESQSLENTCSLLVYMTFLRTLSKLSLNATFYEDSTENEMYCKSLWEWLVLLRRLKFKVLQSIHNLWKNSPRDSDSHVRSEAELTFGYIFFIIPCPVEKAEGCQKTCQPIFKNFIQLKFNSELHINLSFVLRLINIVIREIDEPDTKRHKQLVKNQANACKNAKVYIKVSIFILGSNGLKAWYLKNASYY